MVKPHHCDGRNTMMIHGNNAIAQQSGSNVISDPNDWSHSSMRRNDRETSKYNSQQW